MGKEAVEGGKWEWEVVEKLPLITVPKEKRTFGAVLSFVCEESHYDFRRLPRKQGFRVVPEEMEKPHPSYRWCAYQLPRERQWFNSASFPKRLPSCGVGCAFDEVTGILVIIGEDSHLYAFGCLPEAIGAELVYTSDDPSW